MNCPSCGAKVEFVPWMLTYACPYCGTISFFEKDVLKETWEKTEIVPFPTTFEYWKNYFAVKSNDNNDKIVWKQVDWLSEKEYNNKKLDSYLVKVYVFWHIRYTNEWSFYDKFFLRVLDDKLSLDRNRNLLAEEDEGQIKLYYAEKETADGTFDEIFDYNWPYKNWFFIQEKWIQQIEWFEWSFPIDILWIKTSKYLNLVWTWWKNILLEKYDNWNILYCEGL